MEINVSILLLLKHVFNFIYVNIPLYIMGFAFVLKNLYFCQISDNVMYYGIATDIVEMAA